jgi:hypothetical protein
VRKRARIFKKAHRDTGGGSPPSEKPLTELENRLLSLTGKVVVEGMDIPELGVEEGQEVGGFIQDEHVEVVKEQPKTNIKQYAEPSTSKQTEEQMECGSQNRKL